MGGVLMTNFDQKVESLLDRTYSKEDLLNRERCLKIENSEINATEVDIEKAIDDAISKMRVQMKTFS